MSEEEQLKNYSLKDLYNLVIDCGERVDVYVVYGDPGEITETKQEFKQAYSVLLEKEKQRNKTHSFVNRKLEKILGAETLKCLMD